MHEKSVAIVCASHEGRDRLPCLVKSIYESTVIPKEIVICGTQISDLEKVCDPKSLIKFILSEEKNQIVQRNMAIEASSSQIIIQTDDDLILDSNALEELVRSLTESHLTIVGGLIVDKKTRMPQSTRWIREVHSSPFRRLVLKILNGFRPIKEGELLRSGRLIPIMEKTMPQIIETAWLSSFICYFREARTDAEYLDIKGKSYYEDVYFTSVLKLKGYQLLLNKRAQASHPPTHPTTLRIYLSTILPQYKLVRRLGLSKFLFLIDICCSILILSKNHLSRIN